MGGKSIKNDKSESKKAQISNKIRINHSNTQRIRKSYF